jgi:hypothetical protein
MRTPRAFASATAAVLVAGDRGVAADQRRLRDRRDAGQPEPRRHLALVHDAGAAQRRVLLVQREHAAAQALVLQRAAQHRGAVDRLAVVGEAERAGVAQRGHLGQRLAREPGGDRGEEADRHARLAPRALAQRAQHGRRIDDRVGVRHRDQRDEAAGGGRAGAGVEVLLVLLARRAQVHVRVDEAGEQVAPLAVEHLRARRRLERAGRAELGDLAPAHEDVLRRVDAGARVEHVRAADEQVGGRRVADDERGVRRGAAGFRERHHASCLAGVDGAGVGAARPASSS